MCPFASVPFAGLAGASLATTACRDCTEETEVFFPWLGTLRTDPAAYGIFSGQRRMVEARHIGIWHRVDADFEEAIDAEAALLDQAIGPALLHRGDCSGQPNCSPHSLARLLWSLKMAALIDAIETRGRDGDATAVAHLAPLVDPFEIAASGTEGRGVPVYDIANASDWSIASHRTRPPS
jgi:hypothetical protein